MQVKLPRIGSPRLLLAGLLATVSPAALLAPAPAWADEAKPADTAVEEPAAASETPEATASAEVAKEAKPKYPPFSELLKEPKTVSGLIKSHQDGGKLYLELSNSDLDKDYIVLISIARGISEGNLLGGMTWGFGDDWIWQFRKVDDNIHVVRRNVRFKAKPGSPEASAVELAYTDSVLFSLPVATTGPSGGMVVDFSPVFMSDLPQIGDQLPGFSLDPRKSTYAAIKGFADNVEIEVAATYSSSGRAQFDTVPDSRGLTINVHYSISELPRNNYQPRLADDRVGYFLTAIKDFSKEGELDRFVRYINRWQLEKADPDADLSPPKKPIVFYLEKTVPWKYRKAIREGIEEWNKAFEGAGFVNAIEVRQQSDRDTWDPEDINYNTFRWITAGAGFAMGPSRVNPMTGQILDADIIFDADFVEFWKEEYETFTPDTVARLTGGALDLQGYHEQLSAVPGHLRHSHMCRCELHHGIGTEFAMGSAVATLRAESNGRVPEKMLNQGLKEVTMHEVGHTLGLRHNFKASAWLSLDELHDTEKTSKHGLTASVMDYAPANIAPKGVEQGDYFSTTVGPYDMWAIEYGYKPLSGGTEGERSKLQEIATRAGEAELTFATDEDTRGIDSDPLSNRFDLGDDPIKYAQQRAEIISELWPGLVENLVEDGDGYQKARRAFGILLGNYGRSMFMASRYVGGVYVHRDHKGDEGAKPPFVVVEADKQREALKLIEEHVLSDKPFEFPPELYNHLAASRWNHWGAASGSRLDYPVHETILMWQDRMLSQMLSSLTLQRLHDSEVKVPADQDAFTTAELIRRLTESVFSEVDDLQGKDFTERKPAISSLRRNLQRSYLERLSNLALGNTLAPADCQTVSYLQLELLRDRINKTLEGDAELDTYTLAHLKETSSRIEKVLDARLVVSRP